MRAFSPTELERMRSEQNGAMFDTCILKVAAPTQDDWGNEVDGWVETPGVPCGLNVSEAGREIRRQDGTYFVLAGRLRLSIADGEGLKPKDAITITHRNGELLDPPLAFGVDGPVSRGPTAVTAMLVTIA